LSFCAVMKKMDLYKANVIKACKIVDSGKAVPLSHIFVDGGGQEFTASEDADSLLAVYEISEQDTSRAEMQQRVNKVADEAYKKGFAEGAELQRKNVLPALEAIASMDSMLPQVRGLILERMETQAVHLAVAIAEKILNQEVTVRKDVILGVLKGALKNISETDGMKIRINPLDFRFMMEVKQDFLQSFDGVRNLVFEEDVSIKRGGAIVETMFGEVDARLESQLKEIKTAMLQL
jgi:flagellar assembly protein FliH